MIDLNTGVPGAGKTLSMVERLAKMIERWGAHPEEGRPIFVHGIPELALPHAVMPILNNPSFPGKNNVGQAGVQGVPDWDAMPDGSLVIIDEAQSCFPPRSSASTPPAHVAWLNTHRHRGFDIWLTTQHPKLIDGSVRALVGRHQHFRRMFGGSRAVVYEWDACSDSLSGLANAVTSYWSYPKKVFNWYKSAEIHTKQTFKLPKWLLAFPLGIALFVFFVPRAYTTLSGAISGKGISSSSSKSPDVSSGSLTPALQFFGYVLQGTRCYAITKTGSIVDEPAKCRENVR